MDEEGLIITQGSVHNTKKNGCMEEDRKLGGGLKFALTSQEQKFFLENVCAKWTK